ncbi:MAG: GNAT family N-acetyltransferase [Arenimonas sp.]
MTNITIRDATDSDFEAIIRLNDVEVQQTSAMDLERLRVFDQLSAYHKVAIVDGHVAAFLLAMRDGAAYRNDNYDWFASRFQSFLYVDRIVVGVDFSGLKIGSSLYKDLFAFAHAQQIQQIVCEYNIEPPNPVSKAFHDKFGFREIGTQWVAGGTKRVSMQAVAV